MSFTFTIVIQTIIIYINYFYFPLLSSIVKLFFLDFSDSLHIITLFLILQTSLFYYNRYIDNEKKLLLAKINTGQKGSSSQLVDEKQIMDLLGVVEKTIRVFKMPINVLSDISAFFFTNILCFYLYTKSKF